MKHYQNYRILNQDVFLFTCFVYAIVIRQVTSIRREQTEEAGSQLKPPFLLKLLYKFMQTTHMI